MHQYKKQINPTSGATVVADGSNVCCSSLILPSCKHTWDRQRWLPAVFSTIWGNVGRLWKPQQSLLTPGFPTCRLLTAIYHSLTPQPSPELQPQFLLSCAGGWALLAPLLVTGCCGSNAFFSHCLWVKKATVSCFYCCRTQFVVVWMCSCVNSFASCWGPSCVHSALFRIALWVPPAKHRWFKASSTAVYGGV